MVSICWRRRRPRLVPGGVLLIDDYGWWQGSRKAVDEFRRERNIVDPMIPVDSKCVFWRKSAAA